MFYLYYRAQKQSRKFHDGKHTMQPESVKLMRAGKLPLPEDRQWVAKTRDNHRTASRVLMAVCSLACGNVRMEEWSPLTLFATGQRSVQMEVMKMRSSAKEKKPC